MLLEDRSAQDAVGSSLQFTTSRRLPLRSARRYSRPRLPLPYRVPEFPLALLLPAHRATFAYLFAGRRYPVSRFVTK
jgi:hypothetical protein